MRAGAGAAAAAWPAAAGGQRRGVHCLEGAAAAGACLRAGRGPSNLRMHRPHCRHHRHYYHPGEGRPNCSTLLLALHRCLAARLGSVTKFSGLLERNHRQLLRRTSHHCARWFKEHMAMLLLLRRHVAAPHTPRLAAVRVLWHFALRQEELRHEIIEI
jgi:hypothetical protein